MKENCAVEEETIDYGWNPANPLIIKFPAPLGADEYLSLCGDLEAGYIRLYIESDVTQFPVGNTVVGGYDLTCEQALRLAAYLNRAVSEIRSYGVRKCMEITGADMQQAPEDVQAE